MTSRAVLVTGSSPSDEVAAAVHWLASAGAGWASGAIVDLTGASYLRT